MRTRAITAGRTSRRAPAGVLTFVGPRQFVVCHFCGLAFRDLGRHVRGGHRLSAEVYRRVWSLPPGIKLVSPSIIRKRAAKADPWLANRGRV